nr:MAG TPA: hypothetical protein [Caudoviricetes sp.]
MAANAISIFLSGVFTVAPQNIFDDIIEDIIRSAIRIHDERNTLIHGRNNNSFVGAFVGITPGITVFVVKETVQNIPINPFRIHRMKEILLRDGCAEDVAPTETHITRSCGACSGNRQSKDCGHQKDSGDCHCHGLQRFQNGFHNDIPLSFLWFRFEQRRLLRLHRLVTAALSGAVLPGGNHAR